MQRELAGGTHFETCSDFLCCLPLSLAGSFPRLAADVRSCQLGQPGTREVHEGCLLDGDS